jgi:hypothetical protein
MTSTVLPAVAGAMTLIGCRIGQSWAPTIFAPSSHIRAAQNHHALQ